jgi:hypothetical protein
LLLFFVFTEGYLDLEIVDGPFMVVHYETRISIHSLVSVPDFRKPVQCIMRGVSCDSVRNFHCKQKFTATVSTQLLPWKASGETDLVLGNTKAINSPVTVRCLCIRFCSFNIESSGNGRNENDIFIEWFALPLSNLFQYFRCQGDEAAPTTYHEVHHEKGEAYKLFQCSADIFSTAQHSLASMESLLPVPPATVLLHSGSSSNNNKRSNTEQQLLNVQHTLYSSRSKYSSGSSKRSIAISLCCFIVLETVPPLQQQYQPLHEGFSTEQFLSVHLYASDRFIWRKELPVDMKRDLLSQGALATVQIQFLFQGDAAMVILQVGERLLVLDCTEALALALAAGCGSRDVAASLGGEEVSQPQTQMQTQAQMQGHVPHVIKEFTGVGAFLCGQLLHPLQHQLLVFPASEVRCWGIRVLSSPSAAAAVTTTATTTPASCVLDHATDTCSSKSPFLDAYGQRVGNETNGRSFDAVYNTPGKGNWFIYEFCGTLPTVSRQKTGDGSVSYSDSSHKLTRSMDVFGCWRQGVLHYDTM